MACLLWMSGRSRQDIEMTLTQHMCETVAAGAVNQVRSRTIDLSMPRWDPCQSPSVCHRYRLSDDGSPHLGYWEAPTSLAGKRPVRAARNRSPAMLTSLSRESGGTAGSVGCPCLGHELFHRIGGRTQT